MNPKSFVQGGSPPVPVVRTRCEASGELEQLAQVFVALAERNVRVSQLLVRLLGWSVAYLIVAPLASASRAPRMRAVGLVMLVTAALAIASRRSCAPPQLRIATFNIEKYGGREKVTDDSRLIERHTSHLRRTAQIDDGRHPLIAKPA